MQYLKVWSQWGNQWVYSESVQIGHSKMSGRVTIAYIYTSIEKFLGKLRRKSNKIRLSV